MTGAIITSWGSPVRGREAKAQEVFMKALGFYEDLAKRGRIHSHREYFSLTGNHQRWGGLLVVEGEIGELLKLQQEEPYQKLLNQASAIVENLTVEICIGGSDQSIQQQVVQYTESLTELGYM